jgi:hypothetical protein
MVEMRGQNLARGETSPVNILRRRYAMKKRKSKGNKNALSAVSSWMLKAITEAVLAALVSLLINKLANG